MPPWDRTERLTRKQWERRIGDEDATVTLDELSASELLHLCQRLAAIEEALRYVVLNAAALDNRFSRLETYLKARDPYYPDDDAAKQRLARQILAGDGTDRLAVGEG